MHTGDNTHQTHEITYMIGHANAWLHLWKFATWRFICRGLAVTFYCFMSFSFTFSCILLVPFDKFRSVQSFSHSVVLDSLWPHGLQHTKLPCPSPTPGAYSDPCPSSQWCHPTISSSVIPFSSAFNLSQHQGLSKRVSSSQFFGKLQNYN